MNKFKNQKIFEAPKEYAQYWHCDYGNRGDNGYDIKYIATSPNNIDNYRDVFTSDRDRIMYTTCFLRLSSKTQIFRVGNNDHLRTRLTHTLEVSQIARTIAKELGVNIDLVEAIALGHDVGHAPFGHAGERQLNEISQNQLDYLKIRNFTCNNSPLKNCNGFKHNQQSVRVLVDYSHNISLTNFCLYGIRNHSSLMYKNNTVINSMSFYDKYDQYCSYQDSNSNLIPSWSLEAIVVYWADEIAQRHHDIEDAYRCHLISKDDIVVFLQDLMQYFDNQNCRVPILDYDKYCRLEHFEEKLKIINQDINDDNKFSKNLSSIVVDFYVSAIIRELLYVMDELSKQYEIESHDDFVNKYLRLPETEIWKLFKLKSSNQFFKINDIFESKLKNVIMPSYDVQRQDGKGGFVIRKLFNAYITNPQQLPDEYIKRIFNIEIPIHLNGDNLNIVRDGLTGSISGDFVSWDTISCRNVLNKILTADKKSVGIAAAYSIIYPLMFRIIFDYISGMTDSFAQDEYRQLY